MKHDHALLESFYNTVFYIRVIYAQRTCHDSSIAHLDIHYHMEARVKKALQISYVIMWTLKLFEMSA